MLMSAEDELIASKTRGDSGAFDRSWSTRNEAHYIHWTREEPENQIQLAFRQHWRLFREIMGKDFGGKRVLEVGCGRGSLSAYFADAGFECTLLDLSANVIEKARRAFEHHGLKAKFDVGDALSLPYASGSFDLVASIGLLEHFEDLEQVIREQVRMLDRDGLLLAYIVPELPDNIQRDYDWINQLIRALISKTEQNAGQQKEEIFRSDAMSPRYLDVIKRLPLRDVSASGVYPLPMISYSPAFPFTLLNSDCEKILVSQFSQLLAAREKQTGKNPWLCDEGYGQAILVWGYKV